MNDPASLNRERIHPPKKIHCGCRRPSHPKKTPRRESLIRPRDKARPHAEGPSRHAVALCRGLQHTEGLVAQVRIQPAAVAGNRQHHPRRFALNPRSQQRRAGPGQKPRRVGSVSLVPRGDTSTKPGRRGFYGCAGMTLNSRMRRSWRVRSSRGVLSRF